MTIDEAIKDLEYGSKQLEMEIKSGLWIKGSESELRCKEGITIDKQYIEWLKELKDLREENKVLIQKCDRLIKEKGADVQPVNDWISVKDRLPEPKTWVLVYIEYPSPAFEIERGIRKTGNIKKMFYDGFYDALGDYKVGDCKVTHWQPLPKPPKGE